MGRFPSKATVAFKRSRLAMNGNVFQVNADVGNRRHVFPVQLGVDRSTQLDFKIDFHFRNFKDQTHVIRIVYGANKVHIA